MKLKTLATIVVLATAAITTSFFMSSANASSCAKDGVCSDAQVDSFLSTMCDIYAEGSSSYAKWVGEARAIADADIKKYPQHADEIEQQFYILNEKSKDILFNELRGTINNKNIHSDLKALVRTRQDLVMLNAEFIGKLHPNMSKTFYQRELEKICGNFLIELKKQYEIARQHKIH